MVNKSYSQTRIGKAIVGITGIMFLFSMISCNSVDTASPLSNDIGSIKSLTLSEVSENSVTLDWELLKTEEGIANLDITYTVYAETNNGEGVFIKDTNTEKVYTLGASVDLGEGRSSTVLPQDSTKTRAIGVVVEGLAEDTPYRIVIEIEDASGNRGRTKPLAYTASVLSNSDISGLDATNIIDSDEVTVTWDPKEEAQFYLIQASKKQLGSALGDNVLAVVCPPGSLLCERPNQFAESLEDGRLKYVLRVNQKGKYKLVVVPFNFQDLSEFHVIDKGIVRSFTEEVLARVEDKTSDLSHRLQAALDNHAQEVQIRVSKAGAPKDLVLTSTGYVILATWEHGIGAEYYHAILSDGEIAATNTIDRYDPSGRFAESGSTDFYDLLPETSYTVTVQSLTVIDDITNLGGSVSSSQRTKEAGGVLDTLAPSTVKELSFSEHDTNGTFKVTWAKPDDAGRGINNTSAQLAGYRVSWGTTPEADEGATNINDPDTLSYTITGLTPSTQYYVKVQAKNDNQEGKTYNAGSVKVTYTIGEPGTVSTLIYSDHTNDGFRVSWDRVTDAGYGPEGPLAFIGYLLEISNQGGDWQSVPRSDYLAAKETLTGLTSGTNYQVRVIVTNELSLAGTASEGGETWTLSAPGPVGALVVSEPDYDGESHTGSFKVSWETPQDTGRALTGDIVTITGYEVTYTEVNGENTGSVSLDATNTELVFTGLKANAEYDILVQAKNENGMGQESHVSGWVPSPPSTVDRDSITFSNPTIRSIQISWNAPEAGRMGGGSSENSPTLYRVEIASKGGQYRLVQDNHPTNVIIAPDLTHSTTYSAKITAKNDWGSTPASESILTGTTLDRSPTAPSAVKDLDVSSFGNSYVVLTWNVPSDLGTTDGITTANLTGYVVKYKKTADSDFITIGETGQGVKLSKGLDGSSTSATVLGLSANTRYTFLVAAVNSVDRITLDEDAATIEQLMAIPAPKGLARNSTTCEESNKVDLTWNTSPGATYYNLYKGGTGRIGGEIAKTSYSDTRLASGTSYTYTVRACNDDGCSDDSEPLTIATLKSKNLRALVNSGKVPSDIHLYGQRAHEIFFHYDAGAVVVAKYVREVDVGKKDGSSYDDASDSLKTVLDGITDASAKKVYVVFLEGGTYPITQTISMKDHVAIVGGVDRCLSFPNTVTTLDGGNRVRLIYNSMLNNNVLSKALLYGVVLTKGRADHGAAVYNSNTSPIFMWVSFIGNTATTNDRTGGSGGGMFNYKAFPKLFGVTFSGNRAHMGGGMYNNDSGPYLIGAEFLDDMYNDNEGQGNHTLVNSILWRGTNVIWTHDYPTKTEQIAVYNSIVDTGQLGNKEVRSGSKFEEGWFWVEGPGEVQFFLNGNISADPQLDALDHYGGLMKTHSIPKNSPAVDKGLHVRIRRDGNMYFSKDNIKWYYTADLDQSEESKDSFSQPDNTLDITAIDATGHVRTGRPDIGVYEAR